MPERNFSLIANLPDRWVRSTCGICSIGCGVEIGVADNQIVGVRGVAGHPVSFGRLGPKGMNQFFASSHPTRGLYPMIRGKRCTWDEAMTALVGKFQEALIEHGPDAVAIYNSGQLLLEEYYTIGKIARAGLGISNIDANTRLCTATTAASLMESFGADGPPGAFEDFDQTECIVLVGHNAAEQSTVLWMRMLAAKSGPMRPKIIVIDPRRTFTVDTGADLHLQLKPGTNVALLNGICNLLIDNGWIDKRFIRRHTIYFDRFKKIVSRCPPERVEKLTGVPQKKLMQAAEWIGTSKSTVTTCLQGVYQSDQATAAACIVNSMHLIMGKIGKPGCAPFQFAGQPLDEHARDRGRRDLSGLPQLGRCAAHERSRRALERAAGVVRQEAGLRAGDFRARAERIRESAVEHLHESGGDLLERIPTEEQIIEKALGRPSKLKAETLVLAKLAGIAPDAPPPPIPYKTALTTEFETALPRPDIPPRLVVENSETTDEERLYTELLFDFESVRANW